MSSIALTDSILPNRIFGHRSFASATNIPNSLALQVAESRAVDTDRVGFPTANERNYPSVPAISPAHTQTEPREFNHFPDTFTLASFLTWRAMRLNDEWQYSESIDI